MYLNKLDLEISQDKNLKAPNQEVVMIETDIPIQCQNNQTILHGEEMDQSIERLISQGNNLNKSIIKKSMRQYQKLIDN